MSKLEMSIDHVRSTLRQFVRDWSVEVSAVFIYDFAFFILFYFIYWLL